MQGYRPRRVRIVEPGLDTYTGPIGQFEFVDGVSVETLNWQDQHQISAGMRIVDADNPEFFVGPVADMERMRDTPADAPLMKSIDTTVIYKDQVQVAATVHYTREELEKIADEKGLSGVRELARAHNRTGRSIQECITAVLDAQGDNPDQTTIAGPGEV